MEEIQANVDKLRSSNRIGGQDGAIEKIPFKGYIAAGLTEYSLNFVSTLSIFEASSSLSQAKVANTSRASSPITVSRVATCRMQEPG